MTQTSADYLGFSAGTNAGFSREILQTIAGQIEAELYRSEVYHQAMSHLKALPEEAGKQVQTLLKSVSRTAIRLAVRQFVKQDKDIPPVEALLTTDPLTTEVTPALGLVPATQNPEMEELPLNAVAPVEAIAVDLPTSFVNSPAPQATPSQNKRSLFRHARKLSRAELAKLAIEERENRLRQVGQTIQQVRETRGLSLRQLYSMTKVPVHQLEALERGWLDRLPEDIYIRGFVQRIGNALGLNGMELVASIPSPDPVQAVLPSWYQPRVKAKVSLHLNSVHLYLGYAALMAGGIAWLSQQAPPTSSFYPDIEIPTDNPAQSSQMTEPASTHKVTASKARMVSVPGIAPPEALR